MKRLLCILSGMNMGGAETFLMKVYRVIDRTRFQLDFCINEKGKCAYEDEVLSYGGRIYRIPTKSENSREFEKQLTSIIKENNYQNVLRITSNGAGFLDLKVAKKAGATHTIARSSNASDGGSFKMRFVHLLGRVLWERYVDTMIAPSDLAAIYTFGKKVYDSGQVHILKNGLDLTSFSFSKEKRYYIREEFGIRPGMTVIGHIGRFEEQKNHAFLVNVFEVFHRSNSNSILLLVGGQGKELERIHQLVREKGLKDCVIFAGIRKDIPAILSAMDVLVMPSFYEGMPNVVIEAQATGLPCVISDSITREANVTGLVKYLALTDSPAYWSKEIEQLVKGKERQSQIEQLENAGYSIDKVAKAFLSICLKERNLA